MGAINTAAYLASIRSKMDAQQQVVAFLESELQKSILGDATRTRANITGVTYETTGVISGGVTTTIVFNGGEIEKIYKDAGLVSNSGEGDGRKWLDAINNGNNEFKDSGFIDQDYLRQLLYQARALLGELRIEEQAWNGEVNSEKTLRKDVNDFAKV